MATNPDSVPVRLVHTTGPLDAPEGYTVPGNQELQLSSVSAVFDGSGASGDFDATLSIYSQDGQLMSRTKAGPTVTAGDSGVATWVPFLRQQASAAPAVTGGFPTYYDPAMDFLGINEIQDPNQHYTFFIDSTKTKNYYLVNTGGDPDAPGNYFTNAKFAVGPLWLGPKNSRWIAAIIGESGPTDAKVDLEVATWPDGTLAQNIMFGLSYLKLETFNFYTAADMVNQWYWSFPWVLEGADGAQVTTSTLFGGEYHTNGGAGWWAVRFSVNGKDPASSDYRHAISTLEIRRVSP